MMLWKDNKDDLEENGAAHKYWMSYSGLWYRMR